MSNHQLCIFGEVLFDHFPDGRRILGGAPFNVAWHLQAFGRQPEFLSRVGDDTEGEEIRRAMRHWGMTEAGLQTDPALPTGSVKVSFHDGEPAYDIVRPSAWDRIDIEPGQRACGLLYHGSLGLRDEQSRQALKQLMQQHKPETVFVDVNLRPPWWDRAQILSTLRLADWVKLNTGEFELLNEGGEGTAADAAGFIEHYGLRGLLLTHGSKGAELLMATGETFRVVPENTTAVVDTVGAGDAFASVIILGLLEGWDMAVALQRAQAFASGIVGRRGATVDDRNFYREYSNQWKVHT